jgi:predicted RNase H-like HicB family nuclease
LLIERRILLRALPSSGLEEPMNFPIELDGEADGRWIAEVSTIPGVIAYGRSREEAIDRAKGLAPRALADRSEHREIGPDRPGANQVDLLFLSFLVGQASACRRTGREAG